MSTKKLRELAQNGIDQIRSRGGESASLTRAADTLERILQETEEKNMEELLNEILDAADHDGAVVLQLQIGAVMYPGGAVKRSPRGKGLFEMLVLSGDPRASEVTGIKVTFLGSSVCAIHEEYKPEQTVLRPSNSIITPGRA